VNWDIITNVLSAWAVIAAVIPVIILLRERAEKNEPKFVVYFELVRDSLACVRLKNVGEVPIEVVTIKFPTDWLEEVNKSFQEHNISADNDAVLSLSKLKDTCLTFMPGQEWVLSFNVLTAYLPKDIPLEINYSYCKIPKKHRTKIITDSVKYDTHCYGNFLLYKSEINELSNTTKKSLQDINKSVVALKTVVQNAVNCCKSDMNKPNEININIEETVINNIADEETSNEN
jgi:hypothetical protein